MAYKPFDIKEQLTYGLTDAQAIHNGMQVKQLT